MSIKFAREFQICENSCMKNQASKSLTLVFLKKLRQWALELFMEEKRTKMLLSGSTKIALKTRHCVIIETMCLLVKRKGQERLNETSVLSYLIHISSYS